MPKIASDKQARIGCKGKNKYWYGFKKHVSVDMQSGLINKVLITPANIVTTKVSSMYVQTKELFMLIKLIAVNLPSALQ